jgi:hypothetical protein
VDPYAWLASAWRAPVCAPSGRARPAAPCGSAPLRRFGRCEHAPLGLVRREPAAGPEPAQRPRLLRPDLLRRGLVRHAAEERRRRCELERDRDRPDSGARPRPAGRRRAAARRDRRRLLAPALRRRRRDVPPAAVHRERQHMSGRAGHLRLPDRGRRLPVPRGRRRPLHRRRRPDVHPADGGTGRRGHRRRLPRGRHVSRDRRRHDSANRRRRRVLGAGPLRHARPQQRRRRRRDDAVRRRQRAERAEERGRRRHLEAQGGQGHSLRRPRQGALRQRFDVSDPDPFTCGAPDGGRR